MLRWGQNNDIWLFGANKESYWWTGVIDINGFEFSKKYLKIFGSFQTFTQVADGRLLTQQIPNTEA